MNRRYREHRARNNEASRVSRAKAKEARSKREWVTEHPDLSVKQREQAGHFLDGFAALLEPATCALLRKHVIAARASARSHYNALLARLEAMTP